MTTDRMLCVVCGRGLWSEFGEVPEHETRSFVEGTMNGIAVISGEGEFNRKGGGFCGVPSEDNDAV